MLPPFAPADIERLVRRNSIVYRCLTPSPAQSLLFGNGPIGGSLHTPDDSLYLLIARCDIWNESGGTGAIAAVRIRGDAGWLTGARAVRQECNLYDAVVRIDLDTPAGPIRFELTAIRGHDLLVVDLNDDRTARAPFTVTVEDWHEGHSVRCRDDVLETVHVNRQSCFAAMNHKVNVDASAIGVGDPLLGRAWGLFVRSADGQPAGPDTLHLPAAPCQRILISAVCQAPTGEVDGESGVREQSISLVRTGDAKLAAWRQDHTRYWREFWNRSYVALESGTGDAEYEERLWYVTLYTIACGSGGPLPLRFNGGAYLLDKDARSWDQEYVFQNMREVYWPLLAAGHEHFLRDFFRLYFDSRKFVRAQTRSLFGVDGLCFREGYTLWGCCVGTDLHAAEESRRRNMYVGYYFSGGLECCLLMEWYYRASGDAAFLRHEFYPLLKEILEFFRNYAKKDADGKYHLAPVNALEVWAKVKDDLPDLCGLHHFLPRALQWGRNFGEAPAVLAAWQDFLDHLPDIPVGRWAISRSFQDGIHAEECLTHAEADPHGIFLPAATGTEARTPRTNMENAELYAIFPWGRVGMDSPAEERRRAENTWNHRTWRYLNNGWAQDVLQLARLGWAEQTKTAQMVHASYHQRFPNGCFISPATPKFYELLTDTPYFDAAGVHAAALNEMLLQSYDGILRIAPAVSGEWSGRFRLHAFDGFAVEAVFVHGRPAAARIVCTRCGRLRVRNYCPESMVVAHDATVTNISCGSLFEEEAKAGTIVEVTWTAIALPARLAEASDRPEVIYPGYKIRPPGVAYRGGHWHDESTGHGQIGLAEDGLFPVTRTPLSPADG